jgi:hypothetical protein
MERDIYDVSQYTDLELLNILDLNPNPTDRELEAKILFLIHKYQNMQNPSGDQLVKFFRDIHHHFFDLPMEEEEEEEQTIVTEGFTEGFTDLKTQYSDAKKQYQTEAPTHMMMPISRPLNDGDITQNNSANPDQLDIDIKELNKDIKQLGVQVAQANKKGSDTTFVNTLSYAKDNLNPILQQTIKRIISIDSQYRDNKKQLSTDFTFNLSENLKDVVSLKLYSIQVPFTWYTISNRYGCNFFLLEGSSPGINKGDFSFKFDISSGNYTGADKLAAAINVSIAKVSKENPDISFGTTNISYNGDTMAAAISLDITQIYRESSYYLYFPYWTTPNDLADVSGLQGTRFQSIPGFLGYNYTSYKCFTIDSATTLPPTTNTISTEQDGLNRIYYVDNIDNTNNYFTIISYYGPDEFSSKSIIDNSYQIKLTLTGQSTRTDIVNDLSNQLSVATFLQESSIVRRDIKNSEVINNGYSYFQLQIKLNRSTTSNLRNLKTIVQFPTETAFGGYSNIWTGLSSCFRFQYSSYELSNIVSETTTVAQKVAGYQVSALSIYLKCMKPTFALSMNDYQIQLKPNLIVGYTLLEFLKELNSEITATNTQTITSRNPTGDFYLPYSRGFIDKNDYFNLDMDLTKKFHEDMYQIDLSNSFLTNTMNLQPYYTDLSATNVFSSRFDLTAIYIFDSSFILTVKPVGNYGNQNEIPYTVPAPAITTYFSYTDLEEAINASFNNAVDSDGNHTLIGTNVSLKYNLLERKIDCSFTVVIQKTLSQVDYSIQFVDPSNELSTDLNRTIILDTNSWYSDFHIDSNQIMYAYDLSNVLVQGTAYAKVKAYAPIIIPQITLIDGFNNTFYLKPYSPGVYDRQGYNDIKFTIPANIPYSRDALIKEINIALASNPITVGSSISIVKLNRVNHSKLRLNVNKVYTAADYSVVFYDPFNFSSCDPVTRSIKTTTWDTTLGWLLGMRVATIYHLSNYASGSSPIIVIRSDTTISLNLYNYFLVCLDDFTQSHLNDGLITLANAETDIQMPSYVNKANYQCNPITGTVTYNTAVTNDGNSLTQKQLYSLNAIANKNRANVVMPNQLSTSKSFGPGPYVTDVFAFIPMKTNGLATGAVYVDYGGSLQQQDRIYFGPVNIQRMAVRLLSDRGEPVDLNGSNWSFSLIVEQLYQQKPTTDNDSGKKK